MFHPKGPTFLELAAQGLSSTRHGYDLLAPKFDYTPFRTPDVVLEVVREELQKRGPVGDALDLCCGTGAGLRMVRPLPGGRLVGLDFSDGMLAEAKRVLAEEDGRAVELVKGDALELPFERQFDLVTCFGAFGHVVERDEPRFVRGIRRALRPGGRFVFVTAPMPPVLSRGWMLCRAYNAVTHVRNALKRPPFVMFYLTFMLERARALLRDEGFAVEVTENIFPAPYTRGVLVVATRD